MVLAKIYRSHSMDHTEDPKYLSLTCRSVKKLLGRVPTQT